MSTPMSGEAFVAAARKAGVDVVEWPGWLTHNRNALGPWDDVKFIVVHHVGSNPTDAVSYVRNILFPGYTGLPGPLCFGSPAVGGRLFMVGNGRANHAGKGSPVVLGHVINEDYDPNTTLNPDHYGQSTSGVDGNSLSYGFEMQYSGGFFPDLKMYWTTVIACAVLCRYHGWSEKSVIGHKEWSRDKIDPGSIDMGKMRRDIKGMISALNEANGSMATAPNPVPVVSAPESGDDDMFVVAFGNASYLFFSNGTYRPLYTSDEGKAVATLKLRAVRVENQEDWDRLVGNPKAVAPTAGILKRA